MDQEQLLLLHQVQIHISSVIQRLLDQSSICKLELHSQTQLPLSNKMLDYMASFIVIHAVQPLQAQYSKIA